MSERLDEWLLTRPDAEFPISAGIPHRTRLTAVSEFLNKEIHPHVEKGALLQGDGYLTDHGPEHIKTVIRRASELVSPIPGNLTTYEAYLLVMAIHFHDVGNIFGRSEHEKRTGDIMREVGRLMGDDSVELRTVQQIARAHGGHIDGDRDTITRLSFSDYVLGAEVRIQLLAALLRFADELADDSSRAARFPLEHKQVPVSSEVFHNYAKSLHTVAIDPKSRTIELRFDLYKADAIRKMGKGAKQVYLLDEIYGRTIKMHTERIYCGRFLAPVVRIDTINVRVSVYISSDSVTPEREIRYSLQERGYPGAPKTLSEVCPDVKVTGKSLRTALLDK
jgi:hypothetical protein